MPFIGPVYVLPNTVPIAARAQSQGDVWDDLADALNHIVTNFPDTTALTAQINAVNTTATNAQSTADDAISASSTAVATANAAQTTADGLAASVSTANTNANTAISTANTAQTTATNAQNTANSLSASITSANTNASNAVTTANNASAAATAAQTGVDDLTGRGLTIVGTGTNNAPTGVVTFTVPGTESINGGALGASANFSAFSGPARFTGQLVGTNWTIKRLEG